jgi:hypothetical protein
VSGAQFPRQIEPAFVDVDGDDCGRSDRLGGHDGAETHSASPEDRNGATCTHPQCVHDRAGTRYDATAERPEWFEGCVARNFRGVSVARDRVRGEGRLAENIGVDQAALAGERGGAVGSGSHEIARRKLRAIGGCMIVAGRTVAAAVEGQNHMIAGSNMGDVRPDGLDDASALMPQHDRLRRG